MNLKLYVMQLFDFIFSFKTTQATNSQPVYIKSCLVISSSSMGISRFNQFISGMKTTWQLSEEDFANIRITVSEALMNAVVHGNKSLSGRSVYISAVRDDNFYTFTIEDEGNGFDYETAQNTFSSENPVKPNGRGILIMKHLADAVRFLKNGKCVQLLFSSR